MEWKELMAVCVCMLVVHVHEFVEYEFGDYKVCAHFSFFVPLFHEFVLLQQKEE